MDVLLLTPEEASEALHIGRSKMYELLASGAVSSVRIGGCRRVPVESLRAYIDRLLKVERGWVACCLVDLGGDGLARFDICRPGGGKRDMWRRMVGR
jgi:excisionase family DNA binding protein